MKNIFKFSILYFIFATSILESHLHDRDTIISIETEENLENLLNNHTGPCVIFFYMDHCGWCAKMHPIMENVAKNSNFHAITFYQANGPELQASIHVKNILQKKITGYPTIFFLNQGEVIDIQIGGTNEDTIIKKLNKLLYTSN